MITHLLDILGSAAYQRAQNAKAEALDDYHYRLALEEMKQGTVRRAAEDGLIIDGTAHRKTKSLNLNRT